MTTPPPLSAFCGWLKQLDASALEPNEVAALDLAFPLFRELDDRLKMGDGTAWHAVTTGMGGKILYVGRGRERRFAGDRTLPRGRYWSLCSDTFGRDSGTLVHEVRAYYSYASRCGVDIFDTTTEQERIAEAHNAGRFDIATVRKIARSFFGTDDYPALILLITPHQMSEGANRAGLQFGKVNLFLYPLRVAAISADRVLDLRLPAAQEWLVRSFLPIELSAGEKRRASSKTVFVGDFRPPTSFESLLPTLLAPEIGGGNPFNQALGAWLRAHGSDGIVYPSARVNCSATGRGGVVIASSGWNFVNFSSTDAPDYRQHFGHILGWEVFLGEKFAARVQQEAGDCFAINTTGVSNQNYSRFNCHAHHSRAGSTPHLFDLSRGYVSVLDLDLRDQNLGVEKP